MIKDLFKKIQKKYSLLKPKQMIDALFTSYMVLIIAAVLALGGLFTFMSTYQLTEQTKTAGQTAVSNAAEVMTEKMDTIHQITYDIMCDPAFFEFESLPRFTLERSQNLVAMKSHMSRALSRSELISELYIYYNESDTFITLSEKEDSTYLSDKIGVKENIGDILDANNASFIDVSGEEKQIAYIKSIDEKFKPGNIYAIYILNSRAIEEIINPIISDGIGGVILYDKKNSCLMYYGDPKLDGDAEYYKKVIDATKSSSDEYVKPYGTGILALRKNADGGKLKLCFVMGSAYYLKKASYIWLLIFIICMLVIGMGVLMAKIYSRRIYRPITNIIGMFKNNDKEYGEKSELKFIESKFVEIQQIQSEFESYNDTYSGYLKEKFLFHFVKKHMSDPEEFKQKIKGFNIHLDTQYYTPLIIKVDMIRGISKTIQLYPYLAFIKDVIVSELESVPEIETVNELYDGEYIGLIICHNNSFDIERIFGEIQKSVYEKLEITITVVLGSCVKTYEEIPDVYERLYHIMTQMKLNGHNLLINIDKWEAPVEFINFSSYDERVRQSIKTGNYEALDEIIDDIFIKRRSMYNETVQMFNSFVIDIISVIKEVETSGEMLLNISPYTSIDEFDTTKDIAAYLKELCRTVGDEVKVALQYKNRMSERIVEYINNNYMKQITLTGVAEEFGLSGGYFSRYFKELTGENFVERLNRVRIEKAKELMREKPAAKIFEIAESVGFISYKTFSDAFKKHEGKAPQSYRREVL